MEAARIATESATAAAIDNTVVALEVGE